MPNIISVADAISQGVTPQSLTLVAEWHERRVSDIRRALSGKKQPPRAFGEVVSERDAARHEEIAQHLRRRSAELAKAVA